jgi:hypothetical protein
MRSARRRRPGALLLSGSKCSLCHGLGSIEITRITREEDCQTISEKVEQVFSRNMNLTKETKNALDFVVTEMGEHIFHHAQHESGGFMCCQSYPYTLELAYVDIGRGIERALADNPATYAIVAEMGLLKAALQPKITGRPGKKSGFGLFWTSKLIEQNSGTLGIQSHQHRLTQRSSVIQTDERYFWPGTIFIFPSPRQSR